MNVCLLLLCFVGALVGASFLELNCTHPLVVDRLEAHPDVEHSIDSSEFTIGNILKDLDNKVLHVVRNRLRMRDLDKLEGYQEKGYRLLFHQDAIDVSQSATPTLRWIEVSVRSRAISIVGSEPILGGVQNVKKREKSGMNTFFFTVSNASNFL